MAKISLYGLQDRQKEIVNSILESGAKYHTINASRQSGKTFAIGYLAFIFGLYIKDNILVVSPTYEQVRIIFDNLVNDDKFRSFFKKVKGTKPYEIETISNSLIKFRSADRPDTLRGGSNAIIIMDEFAFFKEGIFEKILRPSTAAKIGSKIIAASTPRGKFNQFYKLVEQAQLGNDNYKYYFMHYTDNKFYDLKEVEDAKKRLPTDIYQQEYEGVFLSGEGDVFDSINGTITKYNYDYKGRCFAGIDWGRVQDRTVLTILDANRKVIFIKKWDSKYSWEEILNELSAILLKYKPIVYAESNGIGDPLIDRAKQKYTAIKPFITTNSSKREIIESLVYSIRENEIGLPTEELEPDLYEEVEQFTYSITKTGSITYHHKEGFHDDIIDSLAISNYSYNNHNKATKIITQKR